MSDLSELNKVLEAQARAATRSAEEIVTLRGQILELAQKMSVRPGVPGDYGGDANNALAEMLSKDAGFEQLRSGRIRSLSIPIVGGLKNWIVSATGASQPLVPAHRDTTIVNTPHQPLRMRDILPVLPTQSNSVEFPSLGTFTNNARAQGDASPGGIEGEAFAESAFTFTLSSAAVITLGHTAVASQQILSDSAVLGQFLSNELLYGLKLVEENQILTGTGAAGTLNGLTNQATAYSRGVTNDTMLDTLAKAKTQLELSNFVADGIVLNPADFLSMATAKDTQNRYLFGDPKSNTPPSVWNVPIVVSNSMTAGKFLMGDFRQAATVWDRVDAMVELSTSHSDFFQRHLVMLKAWERITLTVQRPTAMCYGAVSHSG
jgi:HK97 family phage major capsid protein